MWRRVSAWLLACAAASACGDADATMSPDGGALAVCSLALTGDCDGGGPNVEVDAAASAPDAGRDAVVEGLLVDGGALAGALAAGDAPVLVDVRSSDEHEAAHIPGARSLDAATLRAMVDGVPGQVAAVVDVAAAFGTAGLAPDSSVVVYDSGLALPSARTLWTLQYMGHADVRVLDGGFARWTADGRDTESDAVSPVATTYPDDAVDASLRVDADWVLAHLDDPDVVLVDARSAAEYAAGHIPGALSVDWNTNLRDGVLKPIDELEVMYADIPFDAQVVTYCQIGSRAAQAYFTLAHLGYDVTLYDGSMAEWTMDSDRPLEME